MYDNSDDAQQQRASFETTDGYEGPIKMTGAAGIKLGSPDWDHPGQPADAGQDWAFETEMTAKQGKQPTTWEDRGGRGRPYSIPKPDRSPNRDGVTRAAVSRLTGRLPSYKLVKHDSSRCPACQADARAAALAEYAFLMAEAEGAEEEAMHVPCETMAASLEEAADELREQAQRVLMGEE